jgi:hypothetical protein
LTNHWNSIGLCGRPGWAISLAVAV